MKQYINGIYDPMLIITDSDNKKLYTIEPSFKYQSFKEYYTKESILHRNWKGNRAKKIKCVDWNWEWSFVDAVYNEDLTKLINLENEEINNPTNKIWLVPHKENQTRKFHVIIKDEIREIDTWPDFNYAENTPNKGYIINFLLATMEKTIRIIDPNAIMYYGCPPELIEGILKT